MGTKNMNEFKKRHYSEGHETAVYGDTTVLAIDIANENNKYNG